MDKVSWRESLWAWCRIAAMSFGGPAGQIAVMHRILVEEKRWISESRFLHALQFCMLLPGPEAQQLMTYCGWLSHRTWGALVAGSLFILPGFLSILALSYLYWWGQDAGWLRGMFGALQPAVVILVMQAMLKLGGKTLRERSAWWIAGGAFFAVFFLDVPYPVLVPLAALAGWWSMRGGRLVQRETLSAGDQGAGQEAVAEEAGASSAVSIELSATDTGSSPGGWGRTIRVGVIGMVLWWLPLGLFAGLPEPSGAYESVGWFFSRATVVTFGGAYSVLGYVSRRAVDDQGWLTIDEMMDGLAMAETTPGPLIQVVQFVGFLATAREPGPWSPELAGLIGACLTTWVTFVPSFLWVLLGAEHVERWYGNRRAQALLHGISAAVIGVLGDLAIRFALTATFGEVARYQWGGVGAWVPDLASWDPVATLVMGLAAVGMLWLKLRSSTVLFSMAILGAVVGWYLG